MYPEKQKPGKNYIPTRLVIILMASLATAIQYTIRLNLSVTIVAMVNDTTDTPNLEEYSLNSESPLIEIKKADKVIGCFIENLNSTDYQQIKSYNLKGNKLNWKPSTQGIILGGFYYGYIMTHIFSGQLASNFGPKNIIFLSLLLSSLLTIATPFTTNYDVIFIIALRVLTGMAQGVLSPAIYTLFSSWVPKSERSTALSLITIGGNIGAVITMPFCGYICEHGNFLNIIKGWPIVFYLFGIFGLLFTFFWWFLVYNTPCEHPRISTNEVAKINNNLDISKDLILHNSISFKIENENIDLKIHNKKKIEKLGVNVPWIKMLTSKQVWIVAIAKFCIGWGNLMLMSKLPSFLEKMLHLPMQKNSMINGMVYVAISISAFIFGYLSDLICRKNWLSKLTSRKLFESIALFGSGICLVLIPFGGCDQTSIISLLILSMIFYASITAGDNPIVMDLAPAYSGSLYGLTNAIASIPGFLAPIYVGVMLESEESIATWNIIFVTSGLIAIFGGIVFLIFASVEPLSWGLGLSYNEKKDSIGLSNSLKDKPKNCSIA